MSRLTTQWVLLGSGLNASTNPIPSSLGTVSPYPSTFAGQQTVSSAWGTQSSQTPDGAATFAQCLLPLGVQDGGGDKPLKLHFNGSTAASTVALTLWGYNKTSGTWYLCKDADGTSTYTVTDNDVLSVYEYGLDPLFLQLGAPSAGTYSIYFDNGLATAG